MKKILMAAILAAAGTAFAAPTAVIETSEGTIEVTLDKAKAPRTVENFVRYAKDGFYSGTVFHRVIKGFMIQGGGMTAKLERKPTHKPIAIESDNGLTNRRGTIAMARTSDPNSATSQFFINLSNNAFLNRAEARDGFGYTVFGQVSRGMDVVDRIGATVTGSRGFYDDVPIRPITIKSVTIR